MSNSISQDTQAQINAYLNFFPKDLSKFNEYHGFFSGELNYLLEKDTVEILIPGFAIGYFEIPVLIELIRVLDQQNYKSKINLKLVDKSNSNIFAFDALLKKLIRNNIILLSELTRDNLKNIINETNFVEEVVKDFVFEKRIFKIDCYSNVEVSLCYEKIDFEQDPQQIYPPKEENGNNYIWDEKLKLNNDFNKFIDEEFEYDLIILSFVLNHVSFWRTLLFYLSKHLSAKGKFLVPEIGNDSLLLNGDIIRWKVNNNVANKSDSSIENNNKLFWFFNKFYQKKFSIISDNWEISAINLTTLKKFLKFNNTQIQEVHSKSGEEYTLDTFEESLDYFKKIIYDKKLFSTFTENIEYLNKFLDYTENLRNLENHPLFTSADGIDVHKVKFIPGIKWYSFFRIKENLIEIKTDNQDDLSQSLVSLKAYIEEAIDHLTNNTSVFFDSDYSNLKDSNVFLKYKLFHISSLIRRFRIFTTDIYSANYRINLLKKKKYVETADNFLKPVVSQDEMRLFFVDDNLEINDKKIRVTRMEKYFKEVSEKLKFIDEENFSNLDLFYRLYSNQFNKPFVINYSFTESVRTESNLDIKIDRENGFYCLNVKLTTSKHTPDYSKGYDKVKKEIDEYYLNNVCPDTKEKLGRDIYLVIFTLLIAKNLLDNRIVSIIPIFRHPFLVAKERGIKDRIGAFTVIFNSTDADFPKKYYEYLKLYMWIGQIFDELSGISKIRDFYKAKEVNLVEQLKAVIAEIMNRNYAHHIGSHISLRATFDKILLRLGKSIDDLKSEDVATIAQMIKKLDQYKDERNEFIAGLNNEPIFHTSYFYQDVILPLLENTLFMDNIAKNEGICYKDINGDKDSDIINGEKSECRLKIKVYFQKQGAKKAEEVSADYYKNKTKTFSSLQIPYFNTVNKINDTFYDNKEIKNDFKVSLPGSLGKHCIFSILENFIRNTAKHSYDIDKHKDKDEIKIILRVNEHQEHYNVELTDNISDGSKAEELQKKIMKSILERRDLGITDMKINACLLAGKKLTDDNLIESLGIDKEKVNIVYKFKIMKSKEIALIGGNWEEKLKINAEGIYYYKNISEYFNKCEIKNFRFAVLDSSIDLEVLTKNHNHLPLRVLIIKSELNNQPPLRKNFQLVEKTDFDGCNDSNEFILKCWDLWLKGFGESNLKLITYFEQKNNEKPTEGWIDFLSTNHSKYCSIIEPQVLYKDNNEEIVPKENLNEKNSFYMLYDRHGGTLDKLGVNLVERNFYEHIDKNNRDFDIIFNIKSEPIFINELVEAGLTKILVVDERAAEASKELITGVNVAFNTKGFGQFRTGYNEYGVRKFDACWGAKIYLATHIDIKGGGNEYELLNKEIEENELHYLKIGFKNNSEKISITAETNFIQYDKDVSLEKNNGWKKNGEPINDILPQKEENFKIDILVIHRTILKKISERMNITDFIDKLDVSRILIVTGGGVVDFIQEHKKPKVISTDILKNYIIGDRPAKLSLVKSLCS